MPLQHPLMNENAHDWATSVDDVDNWFNPKKQIGSKNYSNTGAYMQLNGTTQRNVTGNVSVNATGNITVNATSNTSANAT